MQTTAGSLALAGHRAKEDSAVAARLRAAGAVILGKTNLSEWANFRSNHSSSGWSSRGGQTRNPYALDRNPCGSSSGSGVAVAANLCAAAVGTETDGSIICPSQTCGIVGIKPTLGLVSRAGIIPIAHSQDTAGPMARTVADASLLLAAIAGGDPADPATTAAPGQFPTDYAAALRPDGLRGARIGVARAFFGFSPAVDAIMEACIAALRDAGAEIVDPVEVAHVKELGETEMEVLLYEFHADLDAYLASHDGEVRSLAEVIAFNAAHADEVMPYFGQELMEKAQAKGPLAEEKYLQALAANHHLSREEGIDATLAQPQSRRDRRAVRRAGLADRPHQRRPLHRGKLVAGRCRRLPEHHRACRLCARAARRPLVRRPGLERGEADPGWRMPSSKPRRCGVAPEFLLRMATVQHNLPLSRGHSCTVA